MPHSLGERFGRPGGSGAWRPACGRRLGGTDAGAAKPRQPQAPRPTQRCFLLSMVRRNRNDSVPVSMM
jgi:hypothetical protein